MPRDIPVGNGRLLVAFDHAYQIRDLYYPRVGSENHAAGHAFRFGVWADGVFRWVTDPGWHRDVRYAEDTLVTEVTLEHPDLGLQLVCRDAVDMVFDLYIREIVLSNRRAAERQVRLFFHQDFYILEHPVGDTAYYEPARDAVLHYKGQRWFLINTSVERIPGAVPVSGVEQFATGRKGFGHDGTWRDAEDGWLGGNPITQGSVDSCLAVHASLAPGGTARLHHWIAAGTTFDDVVRLNRTVRERGPGVFLNRTAAYWRFWVEGAERDFGDLSPGVARLFRRSLLVIRTQIDEGGAIMAANDSDTTEMLRDHYSYTWPRDGALVAHALDMAHYPDLTKRFFEFCRRVLTKEGYFLHKYNPDGSLASSWHPWVADGRRQLPVQEDETGLVIWALCRHLVQYKDVEWFKPFYRDLVTRAAEWLASFRDARGLPLPSWDLWEERYGVHAFSVAATWAGLQMAGVIAEKFSDMDHARKWRTAAAEIKAAADRWLWRDDLWRFARTLTENGDDYRADSVLDASLYGLWYFGMYAPDDPRIVATMEAVRERLSVKTDVGGIARYENDWYHQVTPDVANVPGNPWFICTIWLAEWYIASATTPGDLTPAAEILEWVVEHALPSGVLAEQVHPFTNAPLSVSPLTWSHAAFVTVVLNYVERLAVLRAGAAAVSPV